MRSFSLSLLVSFLCAGFVAAYPAAAAPAPVDEQRVKAMLHAEHLNFTPGKRAWLAVDFVIADGWHMYWNGQNDSGMPPHLKIEAPEGFKVGEVLWPAPERHVAPGDIVDSVLHKRMTLLIPIDVPVNAKVGSEAEVRVDAEWLVCKESCVLETAQLAVTRPVRSTMPAAEPDPKAAQAFAAAREHLPRNLPKESPPAVIEWKQNTVSFSAPGASEITFHAREDGVAFENANTEMKSKSDKLILKARTPSKADQRLLGVLEIRKQGKPPEFYTVSMPQPATKSAG